MKLTKWRRVRGLTTAAGLWVSAIVGLCCGAGFYEGAVYTTVLVLVAEVFFAKLEYRLLRDVQQIEACVEYTQPGCLEEIVSRCHMLGVKIVDMEVLRQEEGSRTVLSLHSRYGAGREEILRALAGIEGVTAVTER